MAKPSDYPGFVSILKEWNKKLADSGFRDIEEKKRGELQLKKTGSDNRFLRSSPVVREAKEHYYELISQHILETTFESDLEKQILHLYLEGHTQVEIKKKLNIDGHRCKIYRPIYKWLRVWGMK